MRRHVREGRRRRDFLRKDHPILCGTPVEKICYTLQTRFYGGDLHGGIADMSNTTNTPAEAETIVTRLDRLVERLLDGAVVPFVGAGISGQARIRVKPEEESKDERERLRQFKPVVSDLLKPLKKKLLESLQQQGEGELPELRHLIHIAWEGNLGEYIVNKLSAALNEERHRVQNPETVVSSFETLVWGMDFTKLCELYTMLEGAEALCKTLQIDLMTKLEPLPAHYYLAMLAWEGLVRQLITTNYDTCIEEAHRRCKPSLQAAAKRPPVAVIRDLESFREEAGFLNTGGPGTSPRLQLFKINGCAAHYAHQMTKGKRSRLKAAHSILLTERQLQDFRERQWARELLRMTARSRVLLFSGFGSDEPQVRHTMLLLVEEFGQEDRPHMQCLKEPDLADFPNAPFMQAFDEHLTFNQYQPMFGYAEAHLKNNSSKKPKELLKEIEAFIAKRSAKGLDGESLKRGAGKQLPADLFFARLYLRTWRALLKRHTQEERPFTRWLLSVETLRPLWRYHVGNLCEWLYPDYPGFEFGAFPFLLELRPPKPEEVPLTRPAPLWCWMHAMSLPTGEASRTMPPYPALREEGLSVLSTLFLLFLLFGDLPATAAGTCPMHATHGLQQGRQCRDAGTGIPWWTWIRVLKGGGGLTIFIPEQPEQLHATWALPEALRQVTSSAQVSKQTPLGAAGLLIHLVTEDANQPLTLHNVVGVDLLQVVVPSLGAAPVRDRAHLHLPEARRRPINIIRVPLEEVVKALVAEGCAATAPVEPSKRCQEPEASERSALAANLKRRADVLRRLFAGVVSQPFSNSRLIKTVPKEA